MARQRQKPADDDGIDLEELLEEVRGIRSERDELRQAIEELRSASTPTQRRHAQREVRDAETGLAKALRDAGYHDITADDLEDLRRSRRRGEFEEWYEERKAAEQATAANDDDGDKPKRKKSKAKSKTADDDDQADDDDGDGGGRRGYYS